jgi:hypothetical protein
MPLRIIAKLKLEFEAHTLLVAAYLLFSGIISGAVWSGLQFYWTPIWVK